MPRRWHTHTSGPHQVMTESVTIYRYGAIAWFWRVFIALGLVGGSGGLLLGGRSGEPVLIFMGLVLLIPAAFFGAVLAVRIDRLDEGPIVVTNLLFWRRRISRANLGAPKFREYAQGDVTQIYAPRLWVPVQRRLPIYLDLLGEIPDRKAFAAYFSVPAKALP